MQMHHSPRHHAANIVCFHKKRDRTLYDPAIYDINPILIPDHSSNSLSGYRSSSASHVNVMDRHENMVLSKSPNRNDAFHDTPYPSMSEATTTNKVMTIPIKS